MFAVGAENPTGRTSPVRHAGRCDSLIHNDSGAWNDDAPAGLVIYGTRPA
jgi:hypothetical protein